MDAKRLRNVRIGSFNDDRSIPFPAFLRLDRLLNTRDLREERRRLEPEIHVPGARDLRLLHIFVRLQRGGQFLRDIARRFVDLLGKPQRDGRRNVTMIRVLRRAPFYDHTIVHTLCLEVLFGRGCEGRKHQI